MRRFRSYSGSSAVQRLSRGTGGAYGAGMTSRVAIATRTGLVRQRNEDSGYVGRWLCAVADGMGGHVGGASVGSVTRYLAGTLPYRDLTVSYRVPRRFLVSRTEEGSRMELLRLSRAVRRLRVRPVTLRSWADSEKIPVTWVGRERRFSFGDIDAMKVPGGGCTDGPRPEGLYVRVLGTTGQEPALDEQEAELRATAAGMVVRVFRDRASGLQEDRPGPEKVLAA